MPDQQRIGDYIQTYTGRNFYPLDPRPDDIDLIDIAHSLSLQCRFNGLCDDFYCIAEHSIRCADRAYEEHHCPWIALTLLLHDASEAYLTDVPRPIKPMLTNYHEIEQKVQAAVHEKFGLASFIEHSPVAKNAVKIIDGRMLATESRDLMGNNAYERWGYRMGEPYEQKIISNTDWWTVEKEFLKTHKRFTDMLPTRFLLTRKSA